MPQRPFISVSLGLVMSLMACSAVHAQTNIDLVGHLSYRDLRGSLISNLWGYADEEGNEYALVGVNGTAGETGGFSVVDLSDPSDPQEIFFLPGPASSWREIKVWNDHAYITTEAENGGITIVDLSPLPQSTDLPDTVWLDPAWDTSHSLFIDENGRLYIHGANEGNGGVIMYDLTVDPMEPVRVGQFDRWYVHDSFARGDTLYAAHIVDGFFSIVDVRDPSVPILLGQRSTPLRFTHNVWLDGSGRHLYTTDERADAYVASYDVSDPSDIQFLDKLRSDAGHGTVPHNTYWLPGDYLVQSYYTYGVTIYDCSRPDNLVEVGHYDTSPLEDGGFFGAWGVYPFLPSGRLLVSDIEEGLFILAPDYVRGCRLQGTITSHDSGIPVALAELRIVGADAVETTGIDGLYGVGTLLPGVYEVVVTAPGYHTAAVQGVILATGEVTLLDIQLEPLPARVISGVVRTIGSLDPVPDAQLWLVNGMYSFQVRTGPEGTFTFPGVYDGTYVMDVGAWGWHGACPPDLVVDGADIIGVVIDLERGFADDLALDLGWRVSSTAVRGAWERGTPSPTFFEERMANPGADVRDDCRDKAYVTGLSGGSPNGADVDEGFTLLTSPLFDAIGLPDPHVRYHYWFFNAGGSTVPDDTLLVLLTDGTDTVVIQTVTANEDMSQWHFSNIRIADHITPGTAMRLLIRVGDIGPNDHIVEAGFDDFSVVGSATAGTDDVGQAEGFRVWPVPTMDHCTVVLPHGREGVVQVTDILGRPVLSGVRTTGGKAVVGDGLADGTYVVSVLTDGGELLSRRIRIQR